MAFRSYSAILASLLLSSLIAAPAAAGDDVGFIRVTQFNELKDVMMMLIERGLDLSKLPPPMRVLEQKRDD